MKLCGLYIMWCKEKGFLLFLFMDLVLLHFRSKDRLGGGNGIEWKRMKIIILEYSSISLFESFNGGNEKSIPLFGSLSGREWNG